MRWIWLFVLMPLSAGIQAQQTRANILLLLADDLGYNELGSYGQTIIRTPELDKLAAQGMRFTDFYAGNAVCAPARAVLLTGRSAANAAIRGNAGYFGGDRWEGVALDQDAFTLGEMLQGAGYQTAFVGKWHLDNPDDVETWGLGPRFRLRRAGTVDRSFRRQGVSSRSFVGQRRPGIRPLRLPAVRRQGRIANGYGIRVSRRNGQGPALLPVHVLPGAALV